MPDDRKEQALDALIVLALKYPDEFFSGKGLPLLRPFQSGTQFGAWVSANCDRCKRSVDPETGRIEDYKFPDCDIARALNEAYWGEGGVSPEIGRRMGLREKEKDAYVWPCGELAIIPPQE